MRKVATAWILRIYVRLLRDVRIWMWLCSTLVWWPIWRRRMSWKTGRIISLQLPTPFRQRDSLTTKLYLICWRWMRPDWRVQPRLIWNISRITMWSGMISFPSVFPIFRRWMPWLCIWILCFRMRRYRIIWWRWTVTIYRCSRWASSYMIMGNGWTVSDFRVLTSRKSGVF